MPLVDRRVVLNTWVTAVPSALGHLVQQFFRVVLGSFVVQFVADPASLPTLGIPDGFHVVVGDADGQVCVLETNAAVRFAVKVRLVTFANQRVSLLFFGPFTLDEFQHIGVPDF